MEKQDIEEDEAPLVRAEPAERQLGKSNVDTEFSCLSNQKAFPHFTIYPCKAITTFSLCIISMRLLFS